MESPKNSNIEFISNLEIPMRDGTKTFCDLYIPKSENSTPVLLQRTPYNKSSPQSRSGSSVDPIIAAQNGFATVIQDVRGRFSSHGEFYPLINEIDDGYDSIEWISNQNWSDGKVGMYGGSYVGATQWLAAISGHPALSAIAPSVTASNYHDGWTWQGGAFSLGFNLSWAIGALTLDNFENIKRNSNDNLNAQTVENLIHSKDNLSELFEYLPMKNLPDLKDGLAEYYYDWLAHPEYDEFWKNISIEENYHKISIPSLNIGGWYDIFLNGTLSNYIGMKKNAPMSSPKLIMGPWVHASNPTEIAGNFNFGTKASAGYINLQETILDFFNHWLKPTLYQPENLKPVKIFVMGENKWRNEDNWPLERAIQTKFYLHSLGNSNSVAGDGKLSLNFPMHEKEDTFVYDPGNPVPTIGGGLCCNPSFMAPGAFDHSAIETREDVLIYSTDPLEKPLEVTGPIKLHVFISSSAKDTDFTAKLLDIEPCGYARNLTDGIIRGRFRNTNQGASLLNPGQIYQLEINLGATSNLFLKGHQIRLEISSSNFPRFDRNSNTGGEIGEEKTFVKATQKIFHDKNSPSHIVLPIIKQHPK